MDRIKLGAPLPWHLSPLMGLTGAVSRTNVRFLTGQLPPEIRSRFIIDHDSSRLGVNVATVRKAKDSTGISDPTH